MVASTSCNRQATSRLQPVVESLIRGVPEPPPAGEGDPLLHPGQAPQAPDRNEDLACQLLIGGRLPRRVGLGDMNRVSAHRTGLLFGRRPRSAHRRSPVFGLKGDGSPESRAQASRHWLLVRAPACPHGAAGGGTPDRRRGLGVAFRPPPEVSPRAVAVVRALGRRVALSRGRAGPSVEALGARRAPACPPRRCRRRYPRLRVRIGGCFSAGAGRQRWGGPRRSRSRAGGSESRVGPVGASVGLRLCLGRVRSKSAGGLGQGVDGPVIRSCTDPDHWPMGPPSSTTTERVRAEAPCYMSVGASFLNGGPNPARGECWGGRPDVLHPPTREEDLGVALEA